MINIKYQEGCIFCKISRNEIKSERVGESDNFFAIRDKEPKTKGHTLIISKKHYANLFDIPDTLGNEMLEFMKKIAGKLLDEKYGNGFNVVMNNLPCAGQVVMHAHLHIIPRKEGDGLRMIS